jgi:hypothetical protein
MSRVGPRCHYMTLFIYFVFHVLVSLSPSRSHSVCSLSSPSSCSSAPRRSELVEDVRIGLVVVDAVSVDVEVHQGRHDDSGFSHRG